MMWIVDLKILVYFFVCTAMASYNNKNYDTKQEYINTKWRERLQLAEKTENNYNAPSSSSSSSVINSDAFSNNLRLRHHSRFPYLDRVLSKVHNMHSNARTKHKVASYPVTSTTTDEGLFEDYEENTEENIEEYNDNYDGWDPTDENGNFESDDVSEDENIENEWQAEEPTERPKFVPPINSITQNKWDRYGTRKGVEDSRNQYLNLQPINEQKAANAAIEHYMKMAKEGKCSNPRPKIISVQNVHIDTSKIYTPSCTILHRCEEDTGCCENVSTKCGPKKQVLVHLYFYVKTLEGFASNVEKLPFYNHTECACLEIPKVERIGTTPNPNKIYSSSTTKQNLSPSIENLRRCSCPKEFTPKFQYSSRCVCDCSRFNDDCDRMKEGEEFFSMTDRNCILNLQCGVPLCKHGAYLRHIGRCMRKDEKTNT